MGWGRKGSGAGGFVCRVRVCATQTLRGSSPYNTPPDCLTRWLSPEGWTMYPAMGDTSYNQLLAGSVIRNAACTIRRRGRLAVGGVSVAAVVGRLLQPGRRAAKWLNVNAPTRPVEAGRQSPASPTATDSTAIGELLRFHMHAKPPTATDQLTTNQPTARHIATADSTRLDSRPPNPTYRVIRPSAWPHPVPAASLTDLPWAGLLGRPGHPPPTCTASGWGIWVGCRQRQTARPCSGRAANHTQPYLDLQPAAARLEPASWTQIARVSQSDWFPDMFCPRTGPAPQQQVTAPFGGIDCLLPRAGKQASKLWGGWRTLDRQLQAAPRKCPSSPQILPA
jgi:hypothetical protein